jgi:hypothetical protein
MWKGFQFSLLQYKNTSIFVMFRPPGTGVIGCVSGPALFLEVGSGSGSIIKVRSFRGSKWSRGRPWMLRIEEWRQKMEPLRVFKLVFTNSHPFDEEQDEK